MSYRLDIIANAKSWAAPFDHKPDPADLRGFFVEAGCEQVPTLEQATRSLSLPNGCYLGNSAKDIRHWCGVFATAVLSESGLGVWWTLQGGKMKNGPGVGVSIHYGHQGIQPGDVGYFTKHSHHFIVTDIRGSLFDSVDGNSDDNMIRTKVGRPLASINAYYRIEG